MTSQPVKPFSLTSTEVTHIVRSDDLSYQCYKEVKEAMLTMPPCPDGDGGACLSCLAEAAGVVMALHLKAERADRRLAE